MTIYDKAAATTTNEGTTTTTTMSTELMASTMTQLRWLTTTTKLWNRSVPIVQLALREGPYFPTRHSTSQPTIIRRAAPELAAWPTTPLLGAPTLQPLPAPPHRISSQQCKHKLQWVRRGTRGWERQPLVSGSHDALP